MQAFKPKHSQAQTKALTKALSAKRQHTDRKRKHRWLTNHSTLRYARPPRPKQVSITRCHHRQDRTRLSKRDARRQNCPLNSGPQQRSTPAWHSRAATFQRTTHSTKYTSNRKRGLPIVGLSSLMPRQTIRRKIASSRFHPILLCRLP